MPRPKAPGAPEPKKRSRTGCWNCKAKKVKCDEKKPRCLNCDRNGDKVCDYSIRLNWDGRAKRKGTSTPEPMTPERCPDPGLGAPVFSNSALFSRNSSDVGSLGEIDPAIVLAELPFSSRDAPQPSPQFSKFKGYVPPGTTPRSEPRPSTSGSNKRKSQQEDEPFPEQDYFRNPLENGELPLQGDDEQPLKKTRYGSDTSTSDSWSMQNQGYMTATTSNSGSSISPYTFQHTIEGPQEQSLAKFSDEDFVAPMKPTAPSQEGYFRMPSTGASVPFASNDTRRMSVNSLLIQEEAQANKQGRHYRRNSNENSRFYGIDRGLPDRDIPDNDDAHILDVVTPTLYSMGFGDTEDEVATEFGFGLSSNKVASYENDLHVRIAKSLHPLPTMLHANPMNLMYFHFFIEFTARILVPHDCPANPFKVILPQMAVRDDDLLHLLLAYAASHRARLLGHPQPSNRIAVWVSDVFPNLRHVLEDPTVEISSANVATAIMLASLEIIAPGTFGIEIPWQDHLNIARRMITSRKGSKGVDDKRDRVSHFLIRWFAYLDVLGSFSSVGKSRHNVIFSGDMYDFGKENEFSIDCLLGFSGFLAGILARIADLARQCDEERLTDKGEISRAWVPPAHVVEAAERIKEDLARARTQKYTSCPHRQSNSPQEMAWESVEMAALNEAFHWAGSAHLNRRVLGLGQDSQEVQSAVRGIIGTIYKVREGGSAEACLIFPLFTAGCEAKEDSQRDIILRRIKSVEGSGMTQVHKARTLLERVWATGEPWESLVHGEFFG